VLKNNIPLENQKYLTTIFIFYLFLFVSETDRKDVLNNTFW